MITLETYLAPFRAKESTSDAVLMVGDDEAVKVFIAWRRAPGGIAKMPKKMTISWADLVKAWKIDAPAIARGAGVSEETARAKLDMLIHNRLIYPDGSTSSAAELALQIHMARKLGIKPGKKREKDKDGD